MNSLMLVFFCLVKVAFSVIIENTHVLFEFDDHSGSLSRMVDTASASQLDLIGVNTDMYALWDIQFVDDMGTIDVTNVGRAVEYHVTKAFNIQTLNLTWRGIPVKDSERSSEGSVVDVVLAITLVDSASTSYWSIGVDVVNGTSVGVWQAKLSIPFTVGNNKEGELFFPSGFGTSFTNPVQTAGGGVSSTYPGSGATMQFMAIGSQTIASAGYVAALDSNGHPKLLQYSTSATAAALSSLQANEVSHANGPQVGEVQSFPLGSAAVPPELSFLSVTIYPQDAGVAISPGSNWRSTYMLSVGVISSVSATVGRPLWYEAAVVYRDWALADAKWTQRGPFSARDQTALPDWYRSNSVWLNTHWQCHDVFNETGGDPSFVGENTKLVADVLAQPSVALHWYEWQQGPDPAPEARYKFDTHYPDYFPPRTSFDATVKQLREGSGVYTVPYINGRIFDIKSESYEADDGKIYCAKYMEDVQIITNKEDIDAASDLVSYEETYGSDASFCVANPYSPYWQAKVTDTVDELVHSWGVDGVYIDQIGSAGPKMCWDSTHGHTLGGGSWWREGYIAMLDAIAEKTVTRDGSASAPIVTEDNAEPYMDALQGYLSLVAFKASLQLQPTPSSSQYKQLAPAFPVVYGGYYVAFGAQWYQLDFDDHDWWRGKLAATFVTGTQMGWFSIAGVQDDPDDGCGNMAVGDLLMSPNSTDLVQYLQLLASYRRAIVDYFVDGVMARPVVADPAPPTLTQKVASGGYPLFDYDSMAMTSWSLKSDTATSTILVLTSPTSLAYDGVITVDFNNWGYDQVTALSVSVVSASGERTRLYEIEGPVAEMSVHVPGLDVLVLEFASAVTGTGSRR